MSEAKPTTTGRPISNRAIGALVIVALIIVWILVNRDEVEVSFVFATVTMGLWVALAIAAVGGALAGFLVGRKRYKA